MTITDEEILALRQRNDARAKEIIQAMGEKWLLHKANSPKKLKKKRK